MIEILLKMKITAFLNEIEDSKVKINYMLRDNIKLSLDDKLIMYLFSKKD